MSCRLEARTGSAKPPASIQPMGLRKKRSRTEPKASMADMSSLKGLGTQQLFSAFQYRPDSNSPGGILNPLMTHTVRLADKLSLWAKL